MLRWNTTRMSGLSSGDSKEPAISTRRTRLHEDLKSLLIEALSDQAAYCESFADTLTCAAALAQMRGRLFYADQPSQTARHRRVEAIKLRAFASAAQLRGGQS